MSNLNFGDLYVCKAGKKAFYSKWLDHETEIVESSMSFSSMTRESRGLSFEAKQLLKVLWLFSFVIILIGLNL